MKPLHLIAACARNRVIGRAGRLPWSIPEDHAHFLEQTAGQICVLGRVSFATWPEACADGRRPIVLTRRPLERPGVRRADSFAAALALADRLPGEIFICGGQRIYEEALALAGTRPLYLHLTLIEADVPGDTFFPEWRHLAWREVSRRPSADAHHRYTFHTWVLAPPKP